MDRNAPLTGRTFHTAETAAPIGTKRPSDRQNVPRRRDSRPDWNETPPPAGTPSYPAAVARSAALPPAHVPLRRRPRPPPPAPPPAPRRPPPAPYAPPYRTPPPESMPGPVTHSDSSEASQATS